MKNIKTLIEREFDAFFEFETDNRDVVTSTSAKLFAEHVVGIATAPESTSVQGEPVAWVYSVGGRRTVELHRYRDDELVDGCVVTPLYAEPQPSVQGEPVGWQYYKYGKWWNGDNLTQDQRENFKKKGVRVRNVYAEPQLAEWTPAPDVAELVEALEEGLRAIGDHHAPGDCYATGPMTGDPFRDLVQCPACSFIAMCDDLLAAYREGGESDE